MTLEEAKMRICEELAESRRLKGETRQEIQCFHNGRYDGLMLAKKLVDRVGDDVLKPLRKELERRARMARRIGESVLAETEKARSYGEAWAYRKALELAGEESRKEEQ